jgi:hypothetical protein
MERRLLGEDLLPFAPPILEMAVDAFRAPGHAGTIGLAFFASHRLGDRTKDLLLRSRWPKPTRTASNPHGSQNPCRLTSVALPKVREAAAKVFFAANFHDAQVEMTIEENSPALAGA